MKNKNVLVADGGEENSDSQDDEVEREYVACFALKT